jgi:hypothetical protein
LFQNLIDEERRHSVEGSNNVLSEPHARVRKKKEQDTYVEGGEPENFREPHAISLFL